MKLNIYIVSFALICSFSNCRQILKENDMNTNEITAQNIVEKIQEQVSYYPKHPMYLLRINHAYCGYEILVNDYPIDKNYTHKVYATAEKINRAILRSGSQTVTVRMYPLGDAMQEDFASAPYFENLEGGSSITIEVIRVDDWKNYRIEDEQIISTVTSEGSKQDKFVGAKLPFYEFTFSFNANVPYENEGWLNGYDLRQLDSMELRNSVYNYFNRMRKINEEKDINSNARMYFNLLVRQAKSQYWDKEKTKRVCNEIIETTQIDGKEFQPLKNYELAFFGNGRIVTFKHSSRLGGVDSRLRGKSALYFLYDDQTYAHFLGTYLFLSKEEYNGKDIKLEIVK